jgi:hypothetical protein
MGGQQFNLKLTPVENKKNPPRLAESSPSFFEAFKATGDLTASPVLGSERIPEHLDMTELTPMNLDKAEVMSGSFFGDSNIDFYDSSKHIQTGRDPRGSPDPTEDPNNLKVVSFMDAGFQQKVPSDETNKNSNPAIELEQIPETSIMPEKKTPPNLRKISEVSHDVKSVPGKTPPKAFPNSPDISH